MHNKYNKFAKITPSMCRLQKELKAMIEEPPEGIKIDLESIYRNVYQWPFKITAPKESEYTGEIFKVFFVFGLNYPFEAPTVWFDGYPKPVNLHVLPNGEMCCSLLDVDWSAVYTVETVLQCVLSSLFLRHKNEPRAEEMDLRNIRGLQLSKSSLLRIVAARAKHDVARSSAAAEHAIAVNANALVYNAKPIVKAADSDSKVSVASPMRFVDETVCVRIVKVTLNVPVGNAVDGSLGTTGSAFVNADVDGSADGFVNDSIEGAVDGVNNAVDGPAEGALAQLADPSIDGAVDDVIQRFDDGVIDGPLNVSVGIAVDGSLVTHDSASVDVAVDGSADGFANESIEDAVNDSNDPAVGSAEIPAARSIDVSIDRSVGDVVERFDDGVIDGSLDVSVGDVVDGSLGTSDSAFVDVAVDESADGFDNESFAGAIDNRNDSAVGSAEVPLAQSVNVSIDRPVADVVERYDGYDDGAAGDVVAVDSAIDLSMDSHYESNYRS